MGLCLALLASVSGGISVVFSKKGLNGVNPYLVNGITNVIITLIFLVAIMLSGTITQIAQIQHPVYLTISSLTLSATWVLYYLGLSEGTVGGVLAIQNLCIVFTMIMEHIVLGAPLTWIMIVGSVFICAASLLIAKPTSIDEGHEHRSGSVRWIIYEIVSSVAMSVSLIYTKMDTSPVDSNVTSMIRYGVVAIVSLLIIPILTRNSQNQSMNMDRVAWRSVILGGVLLGLGYVFMYRAITMESVTLVTVIFRMNIVITMLLSAIFLKEKLEKRNVLGLLMMIAGIVIFAF